GLTREATPWLLGAVEWTPDLVVRAVVWLSHQAGKAILKLTQRDYAEHRLSSLVARHGSPGALNGLVFNALGARIRGRSKLPRDLDDGAARFLNLPFYQTGTVRKAPVGPADVAVVRALLQELSPDLVFVAGDLSDPHGTHRMCKEAIDRALAEYVAAGGQRPE